MSGRWNKAVAGKVLQGSSATMNESSGASRSEVSLSAVVKRGLHRPRDDDETRDVLRRHCDSAMTSSTDDASLKLSPGRLSISDLEPIASRDVTSNDESLYRRRRTDSEASVCGRCGELLDHPTYHRRYNVRGDLVPCKSLQGSSSVSKSATLSAPEPRPFTRHGDDTRGMLRSAHLCT